MRNILRSEREREKISRGYFISINGWIYLFGSFQEGSDIF